MQMQKLSMGFIVLVLAFCSNGYTVEKGTVNDAFPALTSGALSKAKLSDLPEGILLSANKIEIKSEELTSQIEAAPAEVRKQLEKNRFFLLENIATEKLLFEVAKKAGKAGDVVEKKDIIQSYFESILGTLEVSDEELRKFYDDNKAMVGGMAFEQVKEQLKSVAMQQKQQEAVAEHIKGLGDIVNISVNRNWVEAQAKLAMDNPVDKARLSGKPTMADFGAHGCGPCDMMTPILEDMENKFAGKANVIFIPVREEQMLASRYGIRSIPVQIFFDSDGREIFRHTGFFPQEECEAWLKKAGVK